MKEEYSKTVVLDSKKSLTQRLSLAQQNGERSVNFIRLGALRMVRGNDITCCGTQ